MGKNNSPPAHLAHYSGSGPPSRATSPPPIVPPCTLVTPTKSASPSAVDVTNPTRPSTPSPLTSSLSSTPVVTCFDAGALPQSPVDDDDNDIFYDALDNLPGIDEPHSHKPVRTQVLQALPGPECDGAAKGRTNVGPSRGSARPTPRTTYAPPPPAFQTPVFRGSSKPAVSPTGSNPSAAAPLAIQAQLNFARLRASEYAPRREATKKALLVGINYQDLGKGRLWHAVRDAARFGHSLKNLGFQPDNIKLITDECGFEAPTYPILMHSIDWLVRGAVNGDVLFFVFSGHCVKDQGLLTSDKRFISRHELHHHLVMRVPSGCELQIVFDCCAAAALIQLQYCIGRMGPPPALEDPEQTAQMNAACEPEANPPLAAELLCPAAQPRGESPHLEPLQGSFHGLQDVAPASPASPTFPDSSTSNPDPAPAQITPPMVNLETFAPAPSNPVVSHRRGGVVAAPPPPSPAPAVNNVVSALGAVAGQASEYVSSWFGSGQAAAPTRPSTPAVPTRAGTPVPGRASTSGDPRRGRQVVVEGDRTPDHFEERKGDFIQPAGKVMVWAGASEEQQAFEAYGGVRHGIVTNAMCSALDACAINKTMLTRRDIWRYLVGDIDKENAHRSERDAKKSLSDRQDPKLRVQHAQLWVSQVDRQPLSSAAPALDQPMIKT